MSQNIGQSIMNLVYVIPHLAMASFICRLVFNELLHITVEPVREPERLDEAVLEAVRHYRSVYGVPASLEDIGVYVYVRPARQMIDRMLTAEKMARIRETAERLVLEGKLRKADHAYEPAA